MAARAVTRFAFAVTGRATNVWLWRNGTWHCVSAHSSLAHGGG